jgi:hypothetical protein
LLLSSTAYDTLKRAVKMYKKETMALRKQGMAANGSKGSELTRIVVEKDIDGRDEAAAKLLEDVEEQDTGALSKESEDSTASKAELDATKEAESAKLVDRAEEQRKAELEKILTEERVTPRINLFILGVLFVVVLAINMLKGGGAFHSPLGIVCGSTGFWIANALMIVWIVLVSIFVRQYLLTKYEAKKRTGYQYVEGDIQWDERASIVYPSVCMFAGFFAGMFGVGTYFIVSTYNLLQE